MANIMKPGEWGAKDGKLAITWWRHGEAARGEPSVVTEVRTYNTAADRYAAAFCSTLGGHVADPSIQSAIEKLAKAETDGFCVVRQPANWRLDASRPILLVVHPGDAIERACDWRDKAVGAKVAELSAANQSGMAHEIDEKLASHDVVVLHRLSSAYLSQSGVAVAYREAVNRCSAGGLVLFGDDLPAASQWILENIPGLNTKDANVFMTGAYADAGHGCITAIGKTILAANPEVNIEVSAHAPTDSSNSVPRWKPTRGREAIQNTEGTIPAGATHKADFYGQSNYYRRVDSRHMNQVSEEWETLTRWESWERGAWVDVGKGFSSRRLQAIDGTNSRHYATEETPAYRRLDSMRPHG